jgi:antitoxin component of RelBE/YafQ-DinJ toxin-antitoxin module
MGKFSDEDLKELAKYIASNPAIPFPELTDKQRERIIKEVKEQLAQKENNAKLIVPY